MNVVELVPINVEEGVRIAKVVKIIAERLCARDDFPGTYTGVVEFLRAYMKEHGLGDFMSSQPVSINIDECPCSCGRLALESNNMWIDFYRAIPALTIVAYEHFVLEAY